MYKIKITKVDIYTILGFLLGCIFFDVDGIEFIFDVKMEYIIAIAFIPAWGIMLKGLRLNSLIYTYLFYFGILALATLLRKNEVFFLLYYALRLITCILLIDHVIRMKHFNAFFKGIKCFMAVAILLTIYFQVYTQDIFGYTLTGNYSNFFASDNYLGFLYIVFLLIVYFTNLDKKPIVQKAKVIIWCGICIWSLVLAWSASALVTVIIFILGFILIDRFKFLRKKVTFISVILSNIVIFYLIVIVRIHTYFEWFISGILHKSMTLSLRTYIWDAAIRNIMKEIVIGYGSCRRQIMSINSFVLNGKLNTVYSHNYILENLIQGGIMACIALGLIYYVINKKSKKKICKENMVYSVISHCIFCVFLMGQAGMLLFYPVNHLPIIFMYYCEEIVQANQKS